jgi:hypothetical protein
MCKIKIFNLYDIISINDIIHPIDQGGSFGIAHTPTAPYSPHNEWIYRG